LGLPVLGEFDRPKQGFGLPSLTDFDFSVGGFDSWPLISDLEASFACISSKASSDSKLAQLLAPLTLLFFGPTQPMFPWN
jgi:hypothetical protein